MIMMMMMVMKLDREPTNQPPLYTDVRIWLSELCHTPDEFTSIKKPQPYIVEIMVQLK